MSRAFAIIIQEQLFYETHLIVAHTLCQKVNQLVAYTNQNIEVRLDVPKGVYFVGAQTTTKQWSGNLVFGY